MAPAVDAGAGADAGAAATEALPRVRMQWTGARRMHAADPFLQAHASNAMSAASAAASARSRSRLLAPPAVIDTLFFTESEHRDSAFVVRVVNNSVAFLHRGSHVVERSFVFPDRVLDAVIARFDAAASPAQPPSQHLDHERHSEQPRARGSGLEPHIESHLCVLVRSDCVNIYTPRGDVFETALPFQANRLFALGSSGLLLQRSPAPAQPLSPRPRQESDSCSDSLSATLCGDKELASRPRFFTLAHPLDEVSPIALTSNAAATDCKPTRTQQQSLSDAFLSDPALEVVACIAAHALLVCFDRHTKRFCAFALERIGAAPPPRAAPVRVVDAQTWRAHRELELLHGEHEKVAISSDWRASPVWTSPPCLKRAVVKPKRSSSGCSGSRATLAPRHTPRSAFIVSDVDFAPMLCVVDSSAGMLLLKRLDGSDTAIETVRCRAAVPLSLSPSRRHTSYGAAVGHRDATDIVVLHHDGRLRLHRGALAVCELAPPREHDRSNNGAWAATTEIRSPARDDASSFEVCGHETRAHLETLHRCAHPLRCAFEPLLLRAFSVLECVLPAAIALTVRAEVVAECQRRQDITVAASGSEPKSNDSGSVSEWRVFCEILTHASESAHSSAVAARLPPHEPDASAFDQLCQSSFHSAYSTANPLLFAHMQSPPAALASHSRQVTPTALPAAMRSVSLLREYVSAVFAALHLLHEDLKLSVASSPLQQQLADLLLRLAARLELAAYSVYYEQETGCNAVSLSAATNDDDASTLFPGRSDSYVPDIVAWISAQVHGASCSRPHDASTRFPMLSVAERASSMVTTETPAAVVSTSSPLWRTVAVCRVYELLLPRSASPCDLSRTHDGGERNDPSATLPTDDDDNDDGNDSAASDSRVALMAFLTQDLVGVRLPLWDLPFGIQFPVIEAISAFRHAPPPFVTEDICEFIGREDLAGGSASRIIAGASHSLEHAHAHSQHQWHHEPPSESLVHRDGSEHEHSASDGLDEVVQLSQTLFPLDQRTKEVARLVRSSRPLCLKLEKTSDASEPDFVQQQQARLLLLCKRAMALPVARGMVTLGSCDVHSAQHQAWQLRVPELPLAGRTPPTNATVALDVSGYAKELTYWPQFHNGCAAGLRLPARDLSTVVNRYWIKYHRPSVAEHQARAARRSNTANTNANSAAGQPPASPEAVKRSLEEAYAAHAGLLLGLGLRGHLKCLSMADVYNYLSLSNEFVTVAILLGMATTAAHCRQRRKTETQQRHLPRRNRDSVGSTASSSSASATSSSSTSNGATADVALEDDDGLPLGSASRAPLVGSGLELTLERSVSKMLCLHIPSLLPPPFAEFSVPASAQTAALLGLGILYQGTGHRLMTELLLTEIARSPSSAQFVSSNSNSGLSTASFDQLEGYALAAGLALGLVVLGRGQTKSGDPGLADMKLEEKLIKYIAGGAQQSGDTTAAGGCLYRGRKWNSVGSSASSLAGDGSASIQSATARGGPGGSTREFKSHAERGSRGDEHVNVGVTACGSALALAFMYMQTGNKSIAAQLAAPDTLILLDAARPDILLVRTLAKNLVMWDSVEPTREWIDTAQVPVQLLTAYRALQHDPHTMAASRRSLDSASGASVHSDVQSICEAFANIVAGACLSVGLRFAGTSNARARATLRLYVVHFRDLRTRAAAGRITGAGNVVAAATQRVTIERCLAVCAQALALVDAGSGHVETLTLLRSINLRQRVDTELTYGNHMALSSAIGLLFVGGGRATVSRSRDAIAALVVALFPMYPMNTADNKYHLQAFRHLYVLAVDSSRLLETIDVTSGANCSVPVQLELRRHVMASNSSASDSSSPTTASEGSRWHTLQTPCLLPELSAIKRLVIASREFYGVEILMAPSKQHQQQVMKATADSVVGSTSTSTITAAMTSPVAIGSHKALTANALRLELLRERNVVLLKRTKRHARGASLTGDSHELRVLLRRDAERRVTLNDDDDELLAGFQTYFVRGDTARAHGVSHDDATRSLWWRQQCQQLAVHHVREDPSRFLTIYLHALHALFRLQQQQQQQQGTTQRLSLAPSLAGLRQLELFVKYCGSRTHKHTTVSSDAADPETNLLLRDDRVRTQATDDFVIWLKLQTESALRALWSACATQIESCADAHVLVTRAMARASSRVEQQQQQSPPLDFATTLVVRALVRHFTAPNTSLVEVVQMASSSSEQGGEQRGAFRLDHFLFAQTPERIVASASQDDERTFWLQLVSFLFY